jgi:hypothetical protein
VTAIGTKPSTPGPVPPDAATARATGGRRGRSWPADRQKPSASVFDDWLDRAAGEGLVEREGTGTKFDPYSYRLPAAGDGES